MIIERKKSKTGFTSGKTYDQTKAESRAPDLHVMTVSSNAQYPYKNVWLVDSCCERHLCNNASRIRNLRIPDGEVFLLAGNDNFSHVTAYCEALTLVWNPWSRQTSHLWLSDTAYIPQHPANLLSTRMLNRRGFFDDTIPGFKTREGRDLFAVQPVPARNLWRCEKMPPGISEAANWPDRRARFCARACVRY